MAFDNKKPFDNKKGGFKKKFDKNRPRRPREVIVVPWIPKTQVGKDVQAGKFTKLGDILLAGHQILESEIATHLIPDLTTEFINLGQAKGKFGGGKRKPSKATQKVTREGSKMSFAMLSICGNKNGLVGFGYGKAGETVPSREKSLKNAKKNMIITRRGCGDWGCFCGTAHSIPFETEGREGSVIVRLIPAPKGTGLVVEAELKKMLELAGIKDVWSKTFGNTSNKINLIKAGFSALKNLQKMRMTSKMMEGRGIKDGEKDE